jgi:hypothetical protein
VSSATSDWAKPSSAPARSVKEEGLAPGAQWTCKPDDVRTTVVGSRGYECNRRSGLIYGSPVDLWRCDGSYVGFREHDGLWSASGRYLGKFVGDDVFGPSGAYLAEILLPDRLAYDPRKRDRRSSPSRNSPRAPRRRRPKYRRTTPGELSDFP